MKILEFNGVSKIYNEKKVLNNFSWNVNEGEIHALLGHNGAGKTTSFMIANGLIPFDRGGVSVLGTRPKENNNQISLLTENLKLYTELSFNQLYKVMCGLYSIKRNSAFQKELTENLNIEPFFTNKTKIDKYSTGMKKKAYLFMLLLNQPTLVFLDEPFAGLDPVAVTEISNTIAKLNASLGITFIISSHNLNEIEKTCNRITIMKDGETCASDYMTNILSQFSKDRRYIVEYRDKSVAFSEKVIGLGALYQKLGDIRNKECLITDIRENKISLNEIYLNYYQGSYENEMNSMIV